MSPVLLAARPVRTTHSRTLGSSVVVVSVLTVALLTLSWSHAMAQQDRASMVFRKVPSKPVHTVIPQGYSHQNLHLKFHEGTAVRLNEKQFVSSAGVDIQPVQDVLRNYATAKPEPLFSRSPEVLDRDKLRIEAKSGRQQASKSLYYRVRVEADVDLTHLIDELNALDVVEIAYPEPLPMPLPVTPDFTGMQGHFDPAPSGINADIGADVCGGQGSQARVIDVEYDWNFSHEDVTKAVGALIPNGTPAAPFPNDHGTAVMGILVGDVNSFGIDGIAPNASLRLVNASTDGGYALEDAIDVAAANMAAGDVMLLEQQIAGPNGCTNSVSGCVAVEWVQAYYDSIVAATADGIIVVEASGNGGENMDDTATYGDPFPDGRADSGAIIVGSGGVAGCVNPERARRPTSTYGARVNVQGWGECVVTTGYGTLQGGAGDNDAYSNTFSGTSSASAVVAGAATALSSAIQTLTAGTPTSTSMRADLMSTGTAQNTGAGTLAGNVGPLPDLRAAFALYETVDPAITCPANITKECTSPSGAYASYTPTATDDCDSDPDISCSPASGSIFALNTTNVDCTATDAVGNNDQCNFDVTVVDTTSPDVVCPADVTVECPTVPVPGLPTVTDACGATAAFGDSTTPSCNNAYSTLRTWTATDVGGNTGQCTQSIVVEDTTGPDLTPPADVTVECVDASGAPADLGSPVTSDACNGPVNTGNDGLAIYPIGTTTVNWSAADCHGNTNTDTQLVTVVDPKRYFSIDSNEWGASYLYLSQQNVYGITKCTLETTQFGGNFLSSWLGLDAMDAKEDGKLLFSTESNRQFGNIYIRQERVYEYDPDTGVITDTGLLSSHGIRLRELIAIDLQGDGTLVFSTASNQRVRRGGRVYYLKHQNAYLYDPVSGSI